MTSRRKSRIAFVYVGATAVVATSIVLYSLVAGLTATQGLSLLLGVLIVVWTIIFTFLEVGRIAARSKTIAGPDEPVDPDAPRRVIVESATGHPYPHHEDHVGSAGRDQGQLTTGLPDQTPFIGELLRSDRRKER
jgi:hypothetical protein